jgi:hypothetical protein
MAWGEKYKCEFADNLGLVWTTKIYEDAYAGAVTELTATGQPLTFNFIGNSDDIYDPVIETEVKLRVWSSTNFALSDLYATEDMHFKVIITTPFGGGDVERFVGFVDCGNYEEPYEDVPYEVTITACCGLKFLKGIKYDDDGTPYNGHLLQSEIILDILAKVGFTVFTEFVNLYEESMDSDVDDSPFDQVRIDVDLFKNMYCYDVLAEIVRTYGAVIRQMGTNHVIYRPVELKSATVYGRYFQGDTNKSGTSWSPQRYIDRSTNSSYLIQVRGGVKMIIPPASKVTIHQDYGSKESWIDNYQLRAETYDSVAGTFENWTAGAGWAKFTITGEAQGVVMQNSNTVPPTSTVKLSQSFGSYIVAASDILIFSFDYMTANFTGSTISAVKASIMIKSDTTSKYLTVADDEKYEWSDTEAFIELTLDVEVGKSGMTTFSRKLTSIPIAGSYTITLWGFKTASACYILYTNLKFFATNDSITSQKVRKTYDPIPDADNFIKKIVNAIWRKKKWVEEKLYNDLPEVVQHDWVKENAINGTELEYDMLLGDITKSGTGGVNIDNVIEQFSGALICNEKTLLQVVHTITLTTGGVGDTADITCNLNTRQATFDTDYATTAANFVTNFGINYLVYGITVTSDGAVLTFTGIAGMEFDGDTAIDNAGGLDGTVDMTVQPDAYSDATSYTTDWNTRGGSESKELMSILIDEMTAQYARPKQLIQIALRDQNPDRAEILTYIFGCYEDDLNKFSGNNRKFVVGRGTFEVKERFLMIDLKEVI